MTESSQPQARPDEFALADAINDICPWSGKPVRADSLTNYGEHVVGFCNPGCRDKFNAALEMFDTRIAAMASGK